MRAYLSYPQREIYSTPAFLTYISEKYPERPAFSFWVSEELRTVSYKQFCHDVTSIGSFFASQFGIGQKIAIIGENSYEWIVAHFSITSTHNVAVPLDKDISLPEAKRIISDCNVRAIIHSCAYADFVAQLSFSSDTSLAAIAMDDLRTLFYSTDARNMPANSVVSPEKINPDDLAAILFTSGTTGPSKGVMLSHHNLCSNVVYSRRCIDILQSTLLLLPFHHSFAWTASVMASLHSGMHLTINHSMRHILRDFQFSKPTTLYLVPMFVESFLKNIHAEAARKNISLEEAANVFFGGKLKLIISGGAQLDGACLDAYDEMNISLINGYGITECSPIVAINRIDGRKKGSIGLPIDQTEVKILHPNENGIGEICVKGNIVMQGYYHDDDATHAAFEDGWFKTGDLGYIDTDGFIYITGRLKNLIILSNGKNVSAEELEIEIQKIPGVKEVVVYESCNKIVAEIFPDMRVFKRFDESAIREALWVHVAKQNQSWPAHKRIGEIRIRQSEFEKTTTRKIKRTPL